MPTQPERAPRWIPTALWAAAVYNLAFGAWAIAWPNAIFDWAGMERPNYSQLWQCLGMVVGVYGVGYAIAAGDPVRHWPIVLVGLLGRILGPIGFGYHLSRGALPWAFGAMLVLKDLIWLPPFVLILQWSRRTALRHDLP